MERKRQLMSEKRAKSPLGGEYTHLCLEGRAAWVQFAPPSAGMVFINYYTSFLIDCNPI